MSANESGVAFRLVDSGWDKEFARAAGGGATEIRIISPFLKQRAVARLMAIGKPKSLAVLTRFSLDDFAAGVSDTAALGEMLDAGARIRGIRNLHSKLYLFGHQTSIITSANLTDAALCRNKEFGIISNDPKLMIRCSDYFERLWCDAGPDLDPRRLDEWADVVSEGQAKGMRGSAPPLGDFGAEVGYAPPPIASPPRVTEAGQGFVKLFGRKGNRLLSETPVIDEIRRSGSHWACTYSRPSRKVEDGALMFMGRMTRDPNDILVYGRGLALAFSGSRDMATAADIQFRPWKKDWPYYIRVHSAEFIAGELKNGPSLNTMMAALESDAFASTKRNARKGEGNTNPRHAYRQQPAVELSPQGIEFLSTACDAAIARHGKLPETELDALDWPDLPT